MRSASKRIRRKRYRFRARAKRRFARRLKKTLELPFFQTLMGVRPLEELLDHEALYTNLRRSDEAIACGTERCTCK